MNNINFHKPKQNKYFFVIYLALLNAIIYKKKLSENMKFICIIFFSKIVGSCQQGISLIVFRAIMNLYNHVFIGFYN